MNYFKIAIDTILPPRCPFTGEIVDSAGTVSAEAWRGLSFITAPQCACCGFPFEFALPSGAGTSLCPQCLTHPPAYDRARAALVYNDASRDFVLGFKHGDQTQSVVCMMPWLRQAGEEILATADLIVPVPLHRWRLLRRRYNQAALMGRELARTVRTGFSADALLRLRPTVTQGHLNAGERKKNVRHAFGVHPARGKLVAGKHVVLIDDVYTTGATVNECAAALKAGGAAEVSVLTLARVVRSGRFD